ncbi:MAG TPA: endonuclease/exonuclease/phosphatase family protein, partial [Ilumatobacteraceae bacterium]
MVAASVCAADLAPAPAAAAGPPATVRFATFNASLNRNNLGQLAAELAVPGSDQPDTVAEIIQRARPDVLLINEFDFDPVALQRFQDNYLEVAHGTAAA